MLSEWMKSARGVLEGFSEMRCVCDAPGGAKPCLVCRAKACLEAYEAACEGFQALEEFRAKWEAEVRSLADASEAGPAVSLREGPGWTPGQVAKKLGVSGTTVLNWLKSGKLEGEQGSTGRWRVSPAALERFLVMTGTGKA